MKNYEKNAKDVKFVEVPEKETPETEPEQKEEIKEKNPKTHKFLFWDVTVEKAEKPAKKTKEHKIPLGAKIAAGAVIAAGVGAAVVKAIANADQKETYDLDFSGCTPDDSVEIEEHKDEGYFIVRDTNAEETQTSNEETKEENE